MAFVLVMLPANAPLVC